MRMLTGRPFCRSALVRFLAGILAGSALALGAFAAPASAGTITTECTLQAQNSPTTVGQSATFRFFAAARLPEEIPPSPFGVVTFFDGLPILGNVLGFAPLVINPIKDNSDVEFSTTDLSVGDHTIYAVLFPAFPTPCPGALPASANHRVNPPPASPSTTSVSSTANPSKYKQSVTFSAGVTRDSGGAVAGTIQFKADGSDLGSPQTVDGGGNASVSTSDLSVGTHAITAEFSSANTNTLGSTGTLGGGQKVDPASTTTAVTSSNNPSQDGQSVTFTAAVASVAPGGGTPTGAVQFKDDGTNLGSPVAVNGSGNATVSTSGLTIGTHVVSASYAPADGNSTSSSGSVSQVVQKAKTTLTYDGATAGDFHDSATLSATLTRQYDSAPLAGKSVHFTMASESCDATTNASGQASCSITPQEPAGPQTVKASFAGDAGFQGSEVSKPFTVTREQTSLTYTGDTVLLNGGTAQASALLKEDDGAPAIAGRSVVFTLGTGAGTQSCTALTDGLGRAACDISPVSQPLGPGTVAATFAQDAYYLASSTSAQTILYAFPSKGGFAIGDRSRATGATVQFFSAQWEKDNSLSGGTAPSAFKGFVTAPGTPPRCGGSFVAGPGNSGAPPATVPSYMGTLVTSKVTKSGANLGGPTTGIVVVKTSSYGASPGHGGKGTVVAVVC